MTDSNGELYHGGELSHGGDPNNHPAVLARRIDELAKSNADGFHALNEKLDGLVHNFATKAEVALARKEAHKEHEAIREEIAVVDAKVEVISKKRWVQNTLSAILGAVLTLLVGFFIANIGKIL